MESQVVVGIGGQYSDLHIAPLPLAPDLEQRRLHLGSQDLIRVAGFAVADGFRLVRFYLADRYLEPLDAIEEESISRDLVEIFEKYDAREVQSALHEDYAGLYVVGIEILSVASGFRILLKREGFIDTSIPDAATNLLTRAWRKLRLA